MKTRSYLFSIFSAAVSFVGWSQYTETINSNRPGISFGSFSVGKKVLQIEAGFGFNQWEHKKFNNATISGQEYEIALRYGFWKEELEVIWEASYQTDELTNTSFSPAIKTNRKGFRRHSLGFKYLVYDPFRNVERYKPNLYSWKANQGIRWIDFIPAVAVYAGANIVLDQTYPFDDVYNELFYNPFDPLVEPTISPKVAVSTQNHFRETWVFVTNVSYDRIGTDYPSLGYILTLTHNLSNPQWSVYLEHQGIKSDIYSDALLRGGIAYLVSTDLQLETSIGSSLKTTPSMLTANIGVSYRLDWHNSEIPQDRRIAKEMRDKEKAVKKLNRDSKKARKKQEKAAKKAAKKRAKAERKRLKE
jgi:hypothetical protein